MGYGEPMRGRWTVLLFLIGCGGGKPAPAATAVLTPIILAEAGAPSPAPSFTSDVAMAKMPPPFQFGSKKAAKRAHPEWASCSGSRAATADLDVDVTLLAKACQATTKMHAVGPLLKNTQAQDAPAQSFKLKAEANHCYRLYAAAAPTIKNMEIFITDSEGALAVEARTDAPRAIVFEDGAVCFTAADDAQIKVSVGAGEGTYSILVSGD
jgi:hypothetical protein